MDRTVSESLDGRADLRARATAILRRLRTEDQFPEEYHEAAILALLGRPKYEEGSTDAELEASLLLWLGIHLWG